MAKKKSVIVRPDQVVDCVRTEIDLSFYFDDGRELKSIKIDYLGDEYWLAKHHQTGEYFTDNAKDPKILDTSKNPPRPRGSLQWMRGENQSKGRPKGAGNKISVKQACERLNANPAEFLAAMMTGNIGELKRHKIKNPHEVTIAQKLKCAEILLNKLVPNLKPVDIDEEGNHITPKQLEDANQRSQIQVYIPSAQRTVAIEATEAEVEELETVGVDQFIKNHEKEAMPYDSEDEEEEFVWRLDK